MTSSKRLRSSMFTREKDFATSTSALIETSITPTVSTSRTTENLSNFSEASRVNSLAQNDRVASRKSSLIEEQLKLITTTTDKNRQTIVNQTQNINEDDWVCPVAVALRRAGYNVPLRPSKSWLERDRKKQALLRKHETSSKEL